MTIRVHVAVGIVVNLQGEILIAKRSADQHQGGLWEFPGGKVEEGETVEAALKREFLEEVNLELRSLESALQIHHDYRDKQVLLDVYLCKRFSGQARGLEGQPLKWVPVGELSNYAFPKANQAIIDWIVNDNSRQ